MRRMFAALVPLILVSCSSKPSAEALLGKWRQDGVERDAETMEFFKDGKLRLGQEGIPASDEITSTWKIRDDGHLEFRNVVYKVTIEGDQLSLENTGTRRTERYRRTSPP